MEHVSYNERSEEKLKAISGGNTDERVVNWFLTFFLSLSFSISKKEKCYFSVNSSGLGEKSYLFRHCCVVRSIVSPLLFRFYLNSLNVSIPFPLFLLPFLELYNAAIGFEFKRIYSNAVCALAAIDPHTRIHSLDSQFSFDVNMRYEWVALRFGADVWWSEYG